MKLNVKNIKRKIRKLHFSFKNHHFFFSDKWKNLLMMHWTYPKKIFLGILLIWLVGAILLYTPISFNYESYQYINNEYVFNLKETTIDQYMNSATAMHEYHFNFLKAIFTSASAFTNTGLSVIPSAGTYLSFFGQFIVFVLIEIGGFGYISLFYLIGKSLRKITKKDLFGTSLLNIERGGTKVSNSPKMIVRIFFVFIIIQIVFFLIFSGMFYSIPFYEQQSWAHFINTNSWTQIQYNVGGKIIQITPGDGFNEKANDLLSLTFDSNTLVKTYHNYPVSLWYSIFLTGSAVNNAGFDLFGYTSLQFLRNSNGISIQVLMLILIVIGGIGFPILYDLSNQVEWLIKYKIMYKIFKKQEYARFLKPKLSVFSKLCLWSALIVSAVSLAILYLTEYVGSNSYVGFEMNDSNIITGGSFFQNNISLINYPISANVQWSDGSSSLVSFWHGDPSLNKNFSIFFNCIASRSSGFSTVNFQNMTEASIVVLAILMFIGTSPSSTGAGIRTTTLFIMIKSLLSWYRGVEKTSMFKRKIPIKTIKESYMVFLSAVILVLVCTSIVFITSAHLINGKNLVADEYSSSNKIFNFSSFFFEICSAFGTSGNSMGITGSSSIQWWNLVILVILMYVGQMSMSAANLLFARKVPKKQESFYLEEDIRIG